MAASKYSNFTTRNKIPRINSTNPGKKKKNEKAKFATSSMIVFLMFKIFAIKSSFNENFDKSFATTNTKVIKLPITKIPNETLPQIKKFLAISTGNFKFFKNYFACQYNECLFETKKRQSQQQSQFL
jgi:hypothetical protein